MIGKTLAHYEITAKLGEGGMGEVYRARDTKLGRDVALKTLPRELSGDPERVARFEREARTLAALQHTNIASLYGFEKASDQTFLVMELAEGEDLSAVIERGAVPVDLACEIARQIAVGLEEAHAKGIVHRDLKPANVKVGGTAGEPRVKILDFGLARAFAPDDPSADDIDNSPTITGGLTAQGVILGTAAYMSPEQARGHSVDARSDVWALGVLLYEMLTGRVLFSKETTTDSLAAVLTAEPDFDALSADVPSGLRNLLRRCLRKDPRQRMHSVADARIVLEEIQGGHLQESEIREATVPRSSRTAWWPWAITALAILALAAVWMRPGPDPVAPESVRFPLELPHPLEDNAGAITWSPDGQTLAVGLEGTREVQGIWVRPLDSEGFRRLEGTGPSLVCFSPDSQWLVFLESSRLKKVHLKDGTIVDLGQNARARGAWLEDGSIVFTQNYASGLFRMSSEGGPVEKLTSPDKEELGHWYAEALPGGRHVLYTSWSTPIDNARIMALDLQTKEQKEVVRGGSNAQYSNTGHLIYVRNRQLLAVPFDAERVEVTGAAVPVLDGVTQNDTDGFTHVALSSDGKLAWMDAATFEVPKELVRLTSDFETQVLDIPPRRYQNPRLSPDGRRLAIAIEDDQTDVWIYEFARGTFTRFTFSPSSDFQPVWTDDGQHLVYAVEQPQFDIHWRPADSSGPGSPLLENDIDSLPHSVTPDGRTLVFHQADPTNGADLWKLSLEGGEPEPILQTRFAERGPVLSPDGRWLAYQSDESGRREVYVQPFPGPGPRIQISAEGGDEIRWSPAGDTLYYRSDDGLMSVAISESEGVLAAARPNVIYTGTMETYANGAAYDVYPDGSGWIFTRIPEEKEPRQIHVELNWAERLEAVRVR